MLRGPGWIPNPAKVHSGRYMQSLVTPRTGSCTSGDQGAVYLTGGPRPHPLSLFFLFFFVHAGHHTVPPATNGSCLGFIRHGAMQLAPAENCWLHCGGLAHVRPYTVSNNACAFHKHVVRITRVLHGDKHKIPAAPRRKSQANPSTRQNNQHSRSTAHSKQTSHP